MKPKYIRKGNTIKELTYTADKITEQATVYKSINAAKRESRKLQGSKPGNGLLQVIETKRRAHIEGNRLVVK